MMRSELICERSLLSLAKVGYRMESPGWFWGTLIRSSPQQSTLPPFTLNTDRRMREFRDCLIQADLSDLNYRGKTFTWWYKRKSNPVAKKLDRILVNDQGLSSFGNSLGFFGEPDFSDHSPCTVILNPLKQRTKKPFKFFNLPLQNENFLSIIANAWFSITVTGSAMYRISMKLKKLNPFIRTFSRHNYSGIEKRVAQAHEKMLKAQARALNSPSNASACVAIEAKSKWKVLAEAEESFFLQRSHVNWLANGDGNTNFYHRMVDTRQSVNHIHYLIDSQDQKVDSQPEIQDHCVDYFSKLLGEHIDMPRFQEEDLSLLLSFRCFIEEK